MLRYFNELHAGVTNCALRDMSRSAGILPAG
jgi:hypothetical protein